MHIYLVLRNSCIVLRHSCFRVACTSVQYCTVPSGTYDETDFGALPKSVFEIRSFLGLVGYYRRFIEDFSRLAAPMTRLTRKEIEFEWNDLCEKAFQELKMRLTSAPFLIVPERG